jgi:hypothetical protein
VSLAPTSNVKSTLLAVIASIGLTPDILSTYLYACLAGTYVRPGTEAEGQCRIGHRSPFSELGKGIPATMFREVQNFNDYITSMNQKLALFQTTWDKAGNCILTDESHRTTPYNMREWKPTVGAMYEMFLFPKYMDSWELKTDGTLDEFCQSLLEAAQTTSKASKSTDAYMSARASGPTSGHTLPKESRAQPPRPKAVATALKHSTAAAVSGLGNTSPRSKSTGTLSLTPTRSTSSTRADDGSHARMVLSEALRSEEVPVVQKRQPKSHRPLGRMPESTIGIRSYHCHHFAKYGNCKFGDECIHDHIRPSKTLKAKTSPPPRPPRRLPRTPRQPRQLFLPHRPNVSAQTKTSQVIFATHAALMQS